MKHTQAKVITVRLRVEKRRKDLQFDRKRSGEGQGGGASFVVSGAFFPDMKVAVFTDFVRHVQL